MKKVSLMVIAFVIIGFFLANCKNSTQQESSRITGTWKMISSKTGNRETRIEPDSVQSLKLITQSHFTWVRFNTNSRLVESSAGGTYVLKGDSYNEFLVFGTLGMQYYLGTESTFKVKFEEDNMTISGNLSSGLNIEQVWQKVK